METHLHLRGPWGNVHIILNCHNYRGLLWHSVGGNWDKYLRYIGQPPTVKNYFTQNVTGAKVRSPCYGRWCHRGMLCGH